MKTIYDQFQETLRVLMPEQGSRPATMMDLLRACEMLDERLGGRDGDRFAALKPIGSGHSATDEDGVMTNEERTTLNGLHALRQAVKMLGKAVAGNGEQSATEQVASVPAAQFGDELVERLAVAYKTAESYNGAWSRLIDVEKTMVRRGVRAMLTELAKMPCELPTAEDIASAWMGYRITNVGLNVCAMRVQRMLAPRISAVVAAKNARVSELEDQVQRLGGWDRYQNIVSKRVAELEKIVAARDATIATLTEERSVASRVAEAYANPQVDTLIEEIGISPTATQLIRLRMAETGGDSDVALAMLHVFDEHVQACQLVQERSNSLRNDALCEVNALLDAAKVPNAQLTAWRVKMLIEERDNARGEASSRAVHQKVADHFITEAKAQIAELGVKVANAERLAAARLRLLEVRDKNDEQKRDEYEKRIAELEAQLAKHALPSSDLDAAREAYFSLGGIESDIGPRNDSGWYWRRAAKMAIAQLESRSAKQAPPVDATGKTPGDFYREAVEAHYQESSEDAEQEDAEQEDFHRIYRESEDVAVQAILDVFGNQRTAEVLRSVNAKAIANMFEGHITRDDLQGIIDAELAKLGSTNPTMVVSAAIVDRRTNQLMLQKRGPKTTYAGLWCTAGGKVKPGEDPRDALARELKEEHFVAPKPTWVLPCEAVYSHDMTSTRTGEPCRVDCYAMNDTDLEGVIGCGENVADAAWFTAKDLETVELTPADDANRAKLIALLAKGTDR